MRLVDQNLPFVVYGNACILTGNLIRDLPTNRVNGLSAQVWRSCSETGPIIPLGSKVGRGET